VPIAVNADSIATWFAGALAGMGWALHPLSLIREHLASGRLVERVPGTDLDVPLYWQEARATSTLLRHLTDEVFNAARAWLIQT
jgi:LysR family transcriptional regulator (chromosome initiation inhibitor)